MVLHKMRSALLLLLVACGGNNPAAPPDSSGGWRGANATAELDVLLTNVRRVVSCDPFQLGCSGSQAIESVQVEGTYRDLRTGESAVLASYIERRWDGLLVFGLFTRDNGVSALDTVTYASTSFTGRRVDNSTIQGAIWTDYRRSSGGPSVSWTTWRADSSAITLRRK